MKMESFVSDMMESVASTRPAFILDPDKESLSKWDSIGKYTAFISASGGDPKETDLVTKHLRVLNEKDDFDSIFIMDSGLDNLITNITETLGILKSKINLVIPYEDYNGLRPRLNSRLYLYKTNSPTNITLYESYKIR